MGDTGIVGGWERASPWLVTPSFHVNSKVCTSVNPRIMRKPLGAKGVKCTVPFTPRQDPHTRLHSPQTPSRRQISPQSPPQTLFLQVAQMRCNPKANRGDTMGPNVSAELGIVFTSMAICLSIPLYWILINTNIHTFISHLTFSQ